MLKSLLQFILVATMAIVGLVGLFIAWWIAVFAVVLLGAWVAWRRFFPRSPAARQSGEASEHEPVVIEGQFEVEREGGTTSPPEAGPGDASGRGSSPRAIDDRT